MCGLLVIGRCRLFVLDFAYSSRGWFRVDCLLIVSRLFLDCVSIDVTSLRLAELDVTSHCLAASCHIANVLFLLDIFTQD